MKPSLPAPNACAAGIEMVRWSKQLYSRMFPQTCRYAGKKPSARFRDFADAIRLVNDSSFGLQAGVFTHDIYRLLQAWDELEVGGVIVNDVPSWRVDNMPYGGVKDSGLGREGIRYAIEDMTEPRLLVIREDIRRH